IGIRIITIARYFRLRQSDPDYEYLLSGMDGVQFGLTRMFDHYEWYSKQNRKQFRLESKASLLVSVAMSLVVLLVGLVLFLGLINLFNTSPEVAHAVGLFLSGCGLFGFLGSCLTFYFHVRRANWLDKEKWKEPESDKPRYQHIQRKEPQWPGPEAGWLVLQQTLSAIQNQLTEVTKAVEALRGKAADESGGVVGGTGGDVSPAKLLQTNPDGKPL
ncbi:MAG: hypothetical protein QOE82_399, partial [Thermoanaerobaculia bacterium]|nr:hypothetical protein [Thermoanaerobaculia bacterium]